MSLSIEPAKGALLNLERALSIKTPSDLERDGTIQRFEYCYEILWKLASKVLKESEVNAETPKSVFRELGRLGWINNVEDWLTFQKSRNETSHEYGMELAEKSYKLAHQFYPLAKNLLQVLDDRLRD